MNTLEKEILNSPLVTGPIAPIPEDYRYTLAGMIAETESEFVAKLSLKQRKKILEAKKRERNNRVR